MTTSIDRLRQMAVLGERAAAELVWTVPNINWREALAAVNALHQAAKEWLDAERADELALEELLAAPPPEPNHEEELRDTQKETRRRADKAAVTLAAAVRRVNGE